MNEAAWPSLPLAEWQATHDTLHMWMQIVGKTRLALAPRQNHWWHVPFYLTSRGLTTTPMPYGLRTLTVEFDFVDHRLVLETSDGASRAAPLRPQAVAEFYREYQGLLGELGVTVRLWPVPVEVEQPIPFPRTGLTPRTSPSRPSGSSGCCRTPIGSSSALPGASWASRVPCTSSGGPSISRSRGSPAGARPRRMRASGGSSGRRTPTRRSASDSGPEAARCRSRRSTRTRAPSRRAWPIAAISPAGAYYERQLADFILPYETVRGASSPDVAVLEFYQSAYDRAATLARWDRAALDRPPAEWP